MIRHLYDVARNDPTRADCGATSGVVRVCVTNVNCPECLRRQAAREASSRVGTGRLFAGDRGTDRH